MYALFQAQGGRDELRNFFTVVSSGDELRHGIVRLRLVGLYPARVLATATMAALEVKTLVGEFESVDANSDTSDTCELTVTECGLGDHRPQSRIVTLKVNQWFTTTVGATLMLDKVTSRYRLPPQRERYESDVHPNTGGLPYYI